MKRKSILAFIMILLTTFLSAGIAGADSEPTARVSVTANKSSYEIGDTVTVTITVTADSGIYAFETFVGYDSDLLSYADAGAGMPNGKVHLVCSPEAENTKSYTQTLKFQAKAAGELTISCSNTEIICADAASGWQLQDAKITSTSGAKVVIQAPKEASDNAKLSKLSVGEGTLSPKFSPDTTEYSVSVPNTVKSLTISVTTADSAAKYSISGSKSLSVGKNKITVTVTAENKKTTKTYTITVTRAEPTQEPTKAPTKEPTKAPTPEPTKAVTVVTDIGTVAIRSVFDGELPDGFSESEMQIGGRPVAYASNETNGLGLVQGTDGTFYVKSGERYFPYRVMSGPEYPLILLKRPDGVAAPDGFSETKMSIGEQTETVYRTADGNPFVLLYAAGPDGIPKWYVYDTEQQTVQRFFEQLYRPSESEPTPPVEPGVTPEPTGEPTNTPEPINTPEPTLEITEPTRAVNGTEQGTGLDSLSEREKIGGIVLIAMLLLTILFLVLWLSERNRNPERNRDPERKQPEASAEDEILVGWTEDEDVDEMDRTFDPRLLLSEEEAKQDEEDDF